MGLEGSIFVSPTRYDGVDLWDTMSVRLFVKHPDIQKTKLIYSVRAILN